MTNTLTDTIKTYYAARTKYEEAKAEATRLLAISNAAENEVIDALIDAKQKSITFEDGTKPTLVKSVTISCTKDNFDLIRSWLVQTFGDDKDYVEETVNKWTLLAKIKSMLEKGEQDESFFPPVLKLNSRPGLRVWGWKGLDEQSAT